MVFDPQFADAEFIEQNIYLVITNKNPLRLILTDRAAYWPMTKRFAVSDPIVTAAVPIADIDAVVIARKGATAGCIVGIVMTLFGVFLTLGGRWGEPQALIVGGVLLAIFGSNRLVVQIFSKKANFKWTAPVAFGKKVKADTDEALTSIAVWCARHSVPMSVNVSPQCEEPEGDAPIILPGWTYSEREEEAEIDGERDLWVMASYTRTITIWDSPVNVTFDPDEVDADLTEHVALLNSHLMWLSTSQAAVKAGILNSLIESKNSTWLDEKRPALSKEEFAARIRLMSVRFFEDTSAELYFSDGSLFSGHTILVPVSADRQIKGVSIAG